MTVVGAGGAGKTRLAVEAARRAGRARTRTGSGSSTSPRSPTPAWWPSRVAAVLGLRPEPGRPMIETLAEHAAGRRMLLLLDTCDAQLRRHGGWSARLLAGRRPGPGAGDQP